MINYLKKFFVLSFCLITLNGCGGEDSSMPEEVETKLIPEVTTIEIQPGSSDFSQEYVGKVKAIKELAIKNQISGTIKEVHFEIGEKVSQGTTLIVLDHSKDNQTQVNYDNLKINLQNAQSNYQLTSAATQESINQAQLQVENSQIALETAQVNLENTKISTAEDLKNAELGVTNAQVSENLNIDLAENGLETAQKSLKNTMTTLQNQHDDLLETAQINLANNISSFENMLDTLNNVLGEEDKNKDVNDSFEKYLGVLDQQSKVTASNTYNEAQKSLKELDAGSTAETDMLTILKKSLETAELIKTAVDSTDNLLNKSISSSEFPKESLDSLKLTINNLQSSTTNNINTILAQIQGTIQGIESSQINLDNQRESLELAVENAEKNLAAAKQKENEDSESTSLKTAKQQLESAKAKIKSQLDAAELQVKSAEKQLENAELSLKSARISRDLQLLSIKSQIDSYQGQLDLIRISVNDLIVKAPFDGIMTAKEIEEGDEISPNQILGSMADISKINIEIELPLEDVRKINIGKIVQIEESDTGVISKISPAANPQNKKFSVTVEVDNKERTYLLGSFISVSIPNEELKTHLFVPLNSVQIQQAKNIVYRVLNNKATETEVTLGEVVDNMVEITTGLTAGDKIITDGFKFVENGAEIKEL